MSTYLCNPNLWHVFTKYQINHQSFILSYKNNEWFVTELNSNQTTYKLDDISTDNGVKFNIPINSAVAVVGPDGSGKTTLIDAAKASDLKGKYSFKRFKRYFRRVLFHVRRGQDRNDLEERMPHVLIPLAWMTFVISRGLFGWIKPIVLDRYFYDYMALNIRSHNEKVTKIKLYSLFSKLIPKPNALIVAVCAPETVQNRKAEMTIENTQALYQIYLDQIMHSGVKHVLFCNTDIEQEISTKQFIGFLTAVNKNSCFVEKM